MRRKGTPCACECDPCKGKNTVRTINNISPDPNGDFIVEAGTGIALLQTGDNSFSISFDPLSPGMPTTLAGYGITDAVTLDTPQTITGIKTLTEAKTSTRAYSAANTTDIVTIGSLASNPNVVHTIGNEIIAGAKTFDDVTTLRSAGGYNLQLKSKTVKIGDSITAWTRINQIQMNDMDDRATGYVQNVMRPVYIGGTYVKVHEMAIGTANDSNVSSEIRIRKTAIGSDAWLETSARTYNASNTNDVVTIGSLASNPNVVHTVGNESIAGNKTFTGNDICGTSYFGITPKKTEFSRSDRSTDHRSWFRLVEDSAGQSILRGFVDVLANGYNAFNLSMDVVDLNGNLTEIPILYIATNVSGTITTVMVGGRLIS